jgi:hypothetical protein
LSTLALEGSRAGNGASPSRTALALRFADLAALVAALPVFLVTGASMLGYGVAAGAWLLQRALQLGADRAAARALASGVRRNALGILAGATLARLWVLTLAILLVGLLGERRAGLAAALLAVVLVTLSLGGRALDRVFFSGERPR